MTQHIVDSLKEELATGQNFSAADLENIIRKKFPNVNDDIVKSAVDTILNDTTNMKSKVAGNADNFKLLVSARKLNANFNNPPNPQSQRLQQQQSQQPQQLQKSQPPNNSAAHPALSPELQQRINSLNESDRQLLQQTAISVVNELLPALQQQIDSKVLENLISSKYNVSSDIASILVELLMLYPDYAKFIKPNQQPNQQNQQQSRAAAK